MVSAGYRDGCGVRSDGRVICWGFNGNGEAPPGPSADLFRSVSVMSGLSCGVQAADGRVACWGLGLTGVTGAVKLGYTADPVVDLEGPCWVDAGGRVGCSSTSSLSTGVPAGTFRAVAAAFEHACAIRTDDRVVCWGDNSAGQAPAGPSADSFRSVAVAQGLGAGLGGGFTCGVRSDGRVVCWGDNSHGQAPAGPSLDRFQSVVTGSATTCGVRDDGRLVCWGSRGI
jgi:alpha-tubulin suppressor-like RCC1 family protein